MPNVISHIKLNIGGKHKKLQTINSTDAIFEKTMVPLTQGDVARGWLMFILGNVKQTEINQPGTSFIVRFKDYLGNIYSTLPEVVTENPRDATDEYYPGTKMPHQKKLK